MKKLFIILLTLLIFIVSAIPSFAYENQLTFESDTLLKTKINNQLNALKNDNYEYVHIWFNSTTGYVTIDFSTVPMKVSYYENDTNEGYMTVYLADGKIQRWTASNSSNFTYENTYNVYLLQPLMSTPIKTNYNMPIKRQDGTESHIPADTSYFSLLDAPTVDSGSTPTETPTTNTGIIGWLQSLWDGIISIPTKILEGLGSILEFIFVPNMEEFQYEFEGLMHSVSPNLNNYDDSASNIFGSWFTDFTQEPQDIYISYDFGIFELNNFKIVDYEALKEAVEFFRPIINGFITLLMALYGYRELLSFIGQAPNMASAHEKATKGDD